MHITNILLCGIPLFKKHQNQILIFFLIATGMPNGNELTSQYNILFLHELIWKFSVYKEE